ncbi:Glucose N-acetyltransferase-like protein 4 [Elsinoe fawcettii]|nr:Glucose N-acetyltransferase-like protein 4 [Elsinoe fawcettii]
MASEPDQYAYCTLITRASYLAGVVLLAHSLKKHSSHPLIVLYTPSLPASSIRALELEASKSNMLLHRTEALLPRENIHVNLIAARFADTWTKLRVFQLHETYPQYKRICYLDADMLIFRNPDAIFSLDLPSDWIAANHACVCNLDSDPWAPSDWTAPNCAYTPLSHPDALTSPTPVTPSSPPTHHLLNSGFFLFTPSPSLWSSMLHFFNSTPLLAEFKFPDQDFLAEFFRNKWRSVGWQYNALKTMRYWHENIWRDDEVVVLHYIVDKPWAKRNKEDGTAGYLGRDGETHAWWWRTWGEWVAEGQEGEGRETVRVVAEQTDSGGELSRDLRDIGGEVQALAGNKGKEKKEVSEPIQPTVRGKVLGEKGHGPRVKGGEGYMPPS